MSDNLPQIVDGIRAELEKGRGGHWIIEFPGFGRSLMLDVAVDGVDAWLVKLSCGKRILFNTGASSSVTPKEFKEGLEKFLRWGLHAAKQEPEKPS